MATVAELRANLASKGYSQSASEPSQQIFMPPITVHLHQLLKSPVVLIGLDSDVALPYQEAAVDAAVARR